MTDAYFHIAPIPYQPGQRFFAPLPEDIQPEVTERIEAGTQVVIYKLSKKWFCSPLRELDKMGRFSWEIDVRPSEIFQIGTIDGVSALKTHFIEYQDYSLDQFSPAQLLYLCERLGVEASTVEEAIEKIEEQIEIYDHDDPYED